MKVLTVTSLFPRSTDPKWGIFIETRMRHFKERHSDAQLTVIAPVPWFPFDHPRFGQYADFAKVPKQEQHIGSQVYYPRYLVIPKIGMLLTPFFMALSILFCIARLNRQGQTFDLIDGHYLYPDGVAIALSQLLQKHRFTLTARGTDLHLIPNQTLPRKMIVWACRRANRLITVCEALRQEAIRLGLADDHIETLRNGIDLELFVPPSDRQQLRTELGIQGPALLCVGRLMELKGQYLVIEALQQIPDAQLYLAGDGPDEAKLRRLVSELGLSQRVHFLGVLDQPSLQRYYGAADLSILASSHEGWANVLLESMACGTPVLATRVWGTPEVVRDPRGGRLTERSVADIGRHINELLADPPERHQVRAYAQEFSWDETSDRLYQLYNRVLAQP